MTISGLLLAALLAAPAKPAADPPAVFPALAEPTLPTPPRQGDPWEPPAVPEGAAELPAAAIDVARTLFAQGLADPRGCEYREIAVVSGSVRGGAFEAETRGWVLPSEEGKDTRFAVCWNGLVYPALRVGPPADPADDVAETVAADAAARREWFESHTPEQRENFPFRRWGLDADGGLEAARPSGVPVCLLLRAGRGDLAARLAAMIPKGRAGSGADAAAAVYVRWAGDWLWSLFDRSIKAHGRGDDRLTLAGCRELARVHPLTEAEADRRGYESNVYLVPDLPIEEQPIVGFLGQLSELTADAARRVVAGPAPATVPREEPPDPGEQPIPALVDRLKDVRAPKWGQPGGISWEDDATVAALVAKGEPAVPALLDVWEQDGRLTRTVDFHRDFFRSRHVVPARTAAAVIVRTILDVRFESLAEARAYWAKHGGKPPAVRWYDTLRDDSAGREKWLEAAGNLTQASEGWAARPGEPPRGEALRDRKPSVLSLFALRAAMICADGTPGTDAMWAHQAACRLALIAFRWSGADARPLLAEQYRRTTGWLGEQRGSRYGRNRDDDLAGSLAALTVARVRAARAAGGSASPALDDYAAFLDYFSPGDPLHRDTDLADALEPVWRFPEEPRARAIAAECFGDPDRGWIPLLEASDGASERRDLLDSPLLGLPAFRNYLLRKLADDAVAATVAYRATDPLDAPTWMGPSLWIEEEDPLAPAEGAAVTVRVGDVYAAALADAEGVPAFGWYWPREQRDAARAAQIAHLRRYGPRYAWSSEPLPGNRSSFHTEARLRLPVLDRAAEPADVAAGRAIFALEGERRVVAGLNLPRAAEPADGELVHRSRHYGTTPGGGSGSSRRTIGGGIVWQAEEVREQDDDGTARWVRHYGVVTPDGLARVPAAELRLKEE